MKHCFSVYWLTFYDQLAEFLWSGGHDLTGFVHWGGTFEIELCFPIGTYIDTYIYTCIHEDIIGLASLPLR